MSFKLTMKAGSPSEATKARPGVNYLTVQRAYPITKEQSVQLLEIAKTARINEARQVYIAKGEEGKRIFGILDCLSMLYGMNLVCENDIIIWKK